MPSPFPGMDPYIEDPEVWSDFHARLAEQVSGGLNQIIQPRYVARMVPRVTYDLIQVDERRSVRPDAGIWETGRGGAVGGAVAVITPAPVQSLVPMEVPLRLVSVEVRETGKLRLVTAIEILSPVNKRPSHEAYDEYQRKRRALLRSETNLLEIDLLRGGERPPLERPVPSAPYYLTLVRARRYPTAEVWPIQLRDPLPTVPVPLLEPDPDAPLDLGAAVAAAYERGAYGALIDYGLAPPPPPLPEAEAAWLGERLRSAGAR
ncbi:MAG: DUF4058 family protein [Armatimonadetes bacterium]|nr:DUF4058 family protein [Armatimonadota bacterium]